MSPPPSLKSILITGGGSGIGAALAVALAERGCQVIISGRRRDALDSTAAGSSSITPHGGDITDPAHRAELCSALAAAEAPRAIFHGAGYFQVGMLAGLSDDDWARSFATNVTARWQLSRDCADVLVGGRVLFIGSDAGANPRAAAAAYSIAQSASETLRRSLQVEWAERDIAVAGFKPGLVDTDMVRGFMSLPAGEFPSRHAYEEYVSSGKIVGPEPIAQFATWLLLDTATERFANTEWDIRNSDHQNEWSDGPLYPEAKDA